jgi:hypothetical protein
MSENETVSDRLIHFAAKQAVIKTIEEVGKHAAKHVAKRSLGTGAKMVARGIPIVGEVLLAVEGVELVVDIRLILARDKAREVLKCNCIQLLESKGAGSETPVWQMKRWVDEQLGTAFVFDGVAMGHPENDFDVKQLSTFVFRWDRGRAIQGNGNVHLRPCSKCRRQAQAAAK